MFPVQPTVGPAISLELDVDDGEVENYEVSTHTDTCATHAFLSVSEQACYSNAKRMI